MSVTSNVTMADMSTVTDNNPPFVPWDNPYNIISAETRATVEKVLICGATEVVMILGIPGNVINIAVFARQGLKDRVNLMLFCLALVDLLNLLCYFSINIACFIEPVDPVLAWNVKTVQLASVLYINLITAIISVAIVTILSVDRCLAVVIPFKVGRILTYKRIVFIITLVTVAALVIFGPGLWLNSITWVTDPITNRPKANLVPAAFALQHPLYNKVMGLFTTVAKTIMVLVVVISCSITVKTLRAATISRAEMSEMKLNKSEIQITIMLLYVCMVMVICVIPYLLSAMVYSIIPDFFMFRKYHNIFVVCQYVIFFTRCLNSASNFYMYALLSSKFRATLNKLFPCRQKRDAKAEQAGKASHITKISQSKIMNDKP